MDYALEVLILAAIDLIKEKRLRETKEKERV